MIFKTTIEKEKERMKQLHEYGLLTKEGLEQAYAYFERVAQWKTLLVTKHNGIVCALMILIMKTRRMKKNEFIHGRFIGISRIF